MNFYSAGNIAEANSELILAKSSLIHLHRISPSDKFVTYAWADALILAAEFSETSDDTIADCSAVRAVLAPNISQSSDFNLLSRWVKTSYCLDKKSEAVDAEQKLKSINYKDPTYINFISSHAP